MIQRMKSRYSNPVREDSKIYKLPLSKDVSIYKNSSVLVYKSRVYLLY